jgi:hypothetical protein
MIEFCDVIAKNEKLSLQLLFFACAKHSWHANP